MKNYRKKIILAIILFISLVCLFVGISYSIFTYFGTGLTNNMITTGRIVFSYSDATGGGNGIKIEDAIPTEDAIGKVLSGSNEYFDFAVSATTTTENIAYEIIASKDEASTLPDEFVKIYLTAFEGNGEVETQLTSTEDGIVTYDQLADTTNPLFTGKTIYYGTVMSGEVAYGRNFRLRMWVRAIEEEGFDYSIVSGKTFSLRVNVIASGSM